MDALIQTLKDFPANDDAAAAFFFKIWGVWCLCYAWVCLGCSHLCFERERKLDEKRSARLMEQFGDKND